MLTLATDSVRRVLLVEDDDGDALLVEDLLEEALGDVALTRCRTLGEALGRLSGEFDCVLLDLQLPDGFGIDAVQQVRASAAGIAVIVLTGLDDEATGELAVEAGAQDYLVKGAVDAALLSRAVRYAIGRQHAELVAQQLRAAEREAEEYARLERGLVPHPLIDDPAVWIASRYRAGRRAAQLGGDFFDVVETADGAIHLLIGDVSGHGSDAAALGAGLRIGWRSLILAGIAGGDGLPPLSRLIQHERRERGAFATLCVLRIAPDRGCVELWRAGHPPPVMIDRDGLRSLPAEGGGPPIGMFDGVAWVAERVALPPGWSLMVYTDGLTEARIGQSSERLGESGLEQLIGDYIARWPAWKREPRALLSHLITSAEALSDQPLADDVAMVMIGCHD